MSVLGVSTIKIFSDLPTDLADVLKQKSSGQKVSQLEDFFSMFYNEILPKKIQQIFWNIRKKIFIV